MLRKTVSVLNTIYCSSSGHYYGKVSIRNGRGKRDVRDFDFQNGVLLHKNDFAEYKGAPKYILDEIKTLYHQMLEGDKLIVYEVNQDGERRYTELRYHDPDKLRYLIERM